MAFYQPVTVEEKYNKLQLNMTKLTLKIKLALDNTESFKVTLISNKFTIFFSIYNQFWSKNILKSQNYKKKGKLNKYFTSRNKKKKTVFYIHFLISFRFLFFLVDHHVEKTR